MLRPAIARVVACFSFFAQKRLGPSIVASHARERERPSWHCAGWWHNRNATWLTVCGSQSSHRAMCAWINYANTRKKQIFVLGEAAHTAANVENTSTCAQQHMPRWEWAANLFSLLQIAPFPCESLRTIKPATIVENCHFNAWASGIVIYGSAERAQLFIIPYASLKWNLCFSAERFVKPSWEVQSRWRQQSSWLLMTTPMRSGLRPYLDSSGYSRS